MSITLNNLSGNLNIFVKIKDSDDFVAKIFKANSSLKANPLYTHHQPKLAHASSTESIDSGYESDPEEVNKTKCLSNGEFQKKANKLIDRLNTRYLSSFRYNKVSDSLIKENRTVLEQFKAADEELYGYANFAYQYVKIPRININNQQEKNETVKNFTLPKLLTNTTNSKIPLALKVQPTKEPINNITSSSEPIKDERKANFHQQLVHVHYKTSEKNQYNQQIATLPRSTFKFDGNIPQTKASLLRTQHIKNNNNLSNKSTQSGNIGEKYNSEKNRLLNKTPDNTISYLKSTEYKSKNNYAKKVVYVNYGISEKDQRAQRPTLLPESNFAFKGNRTETKASRLRAQRIKERYNLSNQSTSLGHITPNYNLEKNKPLNKKPDTTKLNHEIKKGEKLISEISKLKINIINEEKRQIKINSELLKLAKISKG